MKPGEIEVNINRQPTVAMSTGIGHGTQKPKLRTRKTQQALLTEKCEYKALRTATATCPHEEAVSVGSPKKELHSVMPLRLPSTKCIAPVRQKYCLLTNDEISIYNVSDQFTIY